MADLCPLTCGLGIKVHWHDISGGITAGFSLTAILLEEETTEPRHHIEMPFYATVLYPNDDDIKFDMSYYLSKHMPLMQEQFTKHGLKSWEVIEYKPGADGAKPLYAYGANLVFDTAEQLQAALGSEDAKPVFGDMANYTNKQPVFLGGQVTGSS